MQPKNSTTPPQGEYIELMVRRFFPRLRRFFLLVRCRDLCGELPSLNVVDFDLWLEGEPEFIAPCFEKNRRQYSPAPGLLTLLLMFLYPPFPCSSLL